MGGYLNDPIIDEKEPIRIKPSWILFSIFIGICIFIVIFNRAPVTNTNYDGTDIMGEPLQDSTKYKEKFVKDLENGYSAIIYPRAKYKLTAKVKGINTNFLMDPAWRLKLSKYDIGIVWGMLSKEQYDKYISYSMSNRFIYWRYEYEIGLDRNYINNHVANNHTIPANNKILEGLSNLKVNDICYFEGWLVDFDILQYNKKIADMQSSLVRSDDGDGACETFYIEKIIIGEKVYE